MTLISQRHRKEVWDAEQRMEAITVQADSLCQMAKSEQNQRYEARRRRIQAIHQSTVRNLPKMVDQVRGKWLGELQQRKNKAAKQLEEAQAAAAASLSIERDAQEESLSALAAAQKTAGAQLVGFPGLLRKVHAACSTRTPAAGQQPGNFTQAVAQLQTSTTELAKAPLAKLFVSLPWLGWLLGGCALAAGTFLLGKTALGVSTAALIAFVFVAIPVALYLLASSQLAGPVARLTEAATTVAGQTGSVMGQAQASHDEAVAKAENAYRIEKDQIAEAWTKVDGIQSDYEKKTRTKLEAQLPRVSAKLEELHAARTSSLLGRQDSVSATHRQDLQNRINAAHAALNRETAESEAVLQNGQAALAQAWQAQIPPLMAALGEIGEVIDRQFSPWSADSAEKWTAPLTFPEVVPLGLLEADASQAGTDRPLHLDFPNTVTAPLALQFPHWGSLTLETAGTCSGPTSRVLFNALLRLLAAFPPGKVAFTILDPVGLGQNFAGLMHLTDYEESIIHRRIWTQRQQLDERLVELNEHVEKVIQMYLRNEYATISEYNALAGTTAEKCQFLVIADFPHGLSEAGILRLKSLLLSGPRCGVYTIVHRDTRAPLPDGFTEDLLYQQALVLREVEPGSGKFTAPLLSEPSQVHLELEAPPKPEWELPLIHRIGKASIDSNKVEVPFEMIAPSEAEMWSTSTQQELRVAIGRTGATKLQMLAIGKGTKQHALFAGKTGSGKSTLFHVIITNLALWASPDEVEFYLIDFKKGVEFKCYGTHKLPHARVVAIESDRAFGLSVLQRVDEELRRRGDLFRKTGSQDLASFRTAHPEQPLPRTLLLIDEFQELFTEDDPISQNAALLLDRIVRQGRAFGIHVLLGSQTLGGSYTLARTTFGQMVIRVALMCNEADAHLIMDDANSAPRLLTRPGEGIYNDMAGAAEGNSPFQVVWLTDAQRDAKLTAISRRAAAAQGQSKWPEPIIFEGNAPADPAETKELTEALSGTNTRLQGASGRIWLGAPNSIKGPTEVTFRRQSGSQLLVVSQREEAAQILLSLSALALSGQKRTTSSRVFWLDSSQPGSPEASALASITAATGSALEVISQDGFTAFFTELNEELQRRSDQAAPPPWFIHVPGLQRFKKLRQEDEFSFGGSDDSVSPSAIFQKIVTEGPSVGLHLLVAVDTFNNLGRWLNRKALSEFEIRVVFQMSANDSASLVDSPAASNLGLHKAMLFHEQQGHTEIFRPYGPLENAWLEQAQAWLAVK